MSKAAKEMPQLNSSSNGLSTIPQATVRIGKKEKTRNRIGKILSEVSDNEGEEEEQQHQDQTQQPESSEQIKSGTQHLIEQETVQESTEKQQQQEQQQSFGSNDDSHQQPLQLIVSSPTGVPQIKHETSRRSSLSSSRIIGSQPPNFDQLSTTALKESFLMNRTGGNSTLQLTNNGGSIRNLLHNQPSNSSYYTRSAIPAANSQISKNASIINNTTQLRNNSSSSSLLTTEKDLKYLNSLRGSQLSFHDALNKLNYESHLDDSKYSDLFSNRNALLDTLQDSENHNHINECPIPRKYDDFHVTEGIIPNIISKNRSEHQQESTNSQDRLSFVEQLQLICEPQEAAAAKSMKEHPSQVHAKHSKTTTGTKKEPQLRVKVSSLHQSSSSASQSYYSQLPHRSESSGKIYNKTLDSFSKFFLAGSPKNPSNLPAISVKNNNNSNTNNMFSTRSSLLSSSHKPSSSAISSSNRSLPVRKDLLLASPSNPSHNPSVVKTKDIIRQLLGSTSTNLLSRQQHHSSVDSLRETISVELKNKTTKRQEILSVRRWLDEKLHGLVTREELKITEVFTYLQNVFQACLSEMLRQINAECKDRGELLQEIWDSQVTLSEKIFISISNESAEIEMKSLHEINRLHKHYQFELQKQFDMVDEKDKTLVSYKTSLTKAVQENRLIRKKGQRLEKNFKIINNQMNQLQEEYNMLFQENLALLMNARQINWDAAMNEKRRMLEEMNANKKLRNNLMKGGVEVNNDEDLTPEAKAKKLQIDQLVKQFVIDRESNMPIEMLLREEEDEPYEMDEYRQPVVNAFWREISTDTVDLVAVRETWTNTDRLYQTDLGVNTERIECADAETEMGEKGCMNGEGVASIMTQTDLRIVYAMMTQTELNVENEAIQCEILVDHEILMDVEENQNYGRKMNNQQEDNSRNSPTSALTPNSAGNQNAQPLQFASDSKQEESQQEAMLSSVKSTKKANSNQKASRNSKMLKQGGSSSLNKKASVSRYSNDYSPLSASPSQFQLNSKMMLEQSNSKTIQQQSSLTSNNSNTNADRAQQMESNDDKNQEKGEQTTTAKNAKRTSKQGNNQSSKKNQKKQRDSTIGEGASSGTAAAVGSDPGESLFMTGIIEAADAKPSTTNSAVISQEEERRNNFLKQRSESIRKELESEAARKIRVAEIERTEEEAKRIFWIENEAEERSKEEIAQMKDWANKAVQKQRELTRQLEITQMEQAKKNEQILQNNQEMQAKDTEIMKLNEIIKSMQMQVQSRQNKQSAYANNSIHRNSLNNNGGGGGGESPRNSNNNNNNNNINTRRNRNISDSDKQTKQQVIKHSDSIKSGQTSRMNTINDNEDCYDNGNNVRRNEQQTIDQRRRSAANYESNNNSTTSEKPSYAGGRNSNTTKPARPQSSLSFQSQRKQEQEQKQQQLFNNNSKSKMSLFGANKTSNFQQKFNRNNNNNNGQNNNNNVDDNNSASSKSSSSSKSCRKSQNQMRSKDDTIGKNEQAMMMGNKQRNMFSNSKINEGNDMNRFDMHEQDNGNNNNRATKNRQNTTNILVNSPRPNKLSIDEELLSEYVKNESNRNSLLFEERLSNNLSDLQDVNNYDYHYQNSDEHLQAVESKNNNNNYNMNPNWKSQSRMNLKVKIINQRQSDIVHMVDMTPIEDNPYEQSMPMSITGSNGKINALPLSKSLSKGRQAQNIINTANHHREHSNSYSLPSGGSPMAITPPPSTKSIADSIVTNALGINSNNNNTTSAIHVQVNNRQTQQHFTRESVNLMAAGAVKDRISAQGNSSINAKKNALKFYPQIVKIMNSVVSDSLKNMKTPLSPVSSMHVQAYEHFLYIFGLRKVAEIKLQQLLQQAILLKEDYSLVNIFIQLYFKDPKGTQLGFICQMQSLLSENTLTVKLEKGVTSKYRVLLGVMSMFKSIKAQKEVLKGCFNVQEIEEFIKGQDQLVANRGLVPSSSSRNDLLINLSNERINELSSQKLELLDALRDCLQGYRRFKSGLAEQYFSVYWALVSSTENAGIDRNGVELIMMVLSVDQEAVREIITEFNKQVAGQNNFISSNSSTHLHNIHNRTLNFEQFCVFASEFENVFATESFLRAASNDLRSLEDIKFAWDSKKSQYQPLACQKEYTRYGSYFQAICEKLDILAALLNEDFQENSEYLTKHEASFQIADVILSRMVGNQQIHDEQDKQDGI